MMADAPPSMQPPPSPHVNEPIPILRALLRRNEQGDLLPTLTNAAIVLLHDRAFAGCWRRNVFADRIELARPLPAIASLTPPEPGVIRDAMVGYCRMALTALSRLTVGRETCYAAIECAAEQARFHPLQEYLAGLAWDGTARLDTWLSTFAGVEDTPYVRQVGRWFLISAVARAFEPGCQADHVLVLEGEGGVGKSSTARILGGDWFLPRLPSLREADRAAHALAGSWIVEIGELDALRGAAVTEVNDFLTRTEDVYRAPYDRCFVRRPRSCVFIGTTNAAEYLHDTTSATRRWWPVRAVRAADRGGLAQERDMLWAEAVAAYQGGVDMPERPPEARWWPSRLDLPALSDEQDERREGDDAWTGPIVNWLAETDLATGRPRDNVTTWAILEGLNIPRSYWDRAAVTRVGSVLRAAGWSVIRKRTDTGRVRFYLRPEANG